MPRKILIPNFIDNDQWRSLMDAIDHVFSTRIDQPIRWLSKMRDHYLINESVAAKIEAKEMVSEGDLDTLDANLIIQNTRMSGLDIPGASNFTLAQMQRIFRETAAYWYQKGTHNASDFLSYVLGTPVDMTNMWSEDYVTFYPEGDPAIGIPVYSGGTWFPTTHVQFTLDPSSLLTVPLVNLISLFNAVNNHNLVIGAVGLEIILPVAQATQSVQPPIGGVGVPSVALNALLEIEITISNQ